MKKTIAIFFLLVCFIIYYSCIGHVKSKKSEHTYVGTEKCRKCHEEEYDKYVTSDHFHAMDTALPRSVKGDFNNSVFVYFGDTTFFYKKDGRYYVRTKDSADKKADFLISYTFGWQPLQQYLVTFPGGRIQALPFCWDTRSKEKGGQRWFHIYGNEKILPGDELFWTGINQNWNYMCADCHTTNYYKNFDASAETFHSSWTETKVSCESCHGPASEHMEWAKKKYPNDSLKGFAIRLSGEKLTWKFKPGTGIAYPDRVVQNNSLIETCARCHARAMRLTDTYHHGESFLQTHIPSSLSTANYYIDGQIKEEDYEYGSFLQSKMYSQGVTCINCHDPHTMRIKVAGNELCQSCHASEKFDSPDHTHHQLTSTGALCVNCHMPATNYMVIDARRDHSIRIPRPDLSLTMNTPNACNRCHTDKSVNWAAKNFVQWYGDKVAQKKTYGELLFSVSKNTIESEKALCDLLGSNDYPAIAKATALEQYNQFYSPCIVGQVKNYLQSSDPNLRLNALHAATSLQQQDLLEFVVPMLDDPVLGVRTEAMNTLAPLYMQLDPDQRKRFDEVMNEYLAIQKNLGDRPESYLNQGIVLIGVGRTDEAEQSYLMGLKRFPKFIPFYGNLADLYRAAKNETRAKEYLDQGLAIEPRNADLHYARALWFIRNQNQKEGLNELKKSVQLAPANASFTYGFSVALYSLHDVKLAISELEDFTARYGNNALVINGLISIYEDLKQVDKAERYLKLRRDVFGY